MARVVTIPAESDLLCESCGYVLNGLPADARCPECGKPAGESSAALRHPPAWERATGRLKLPAFTTTTAAALFRPTAFFRALSTREAGNRGLRFAQIHWAAASLLFAIAARAHWDWFVTLGGSQQFRVLTRLPFLLAVWAATYVTLLLVTRVMAWVTTWEAGYRGLRLPLPVVTRGLHYHTPHYLPVAVAAAGTVLGYQLALAEGWVGGETGARYLYVLSAEVVAGAAYLFVTYWAAMRNLMYANGAR